MATLETVLHDFLTLSQEERQRFLELLPLDDVPADDWWESWGPEIDRRIERLDSGDAKSIDALESVKHIRARIDAHKG